MTVPKTLIHAVKSVRDLGYNLLVVENFAKDCSHHYGEIQDAIDTLREDQINLLALLAQEIADQAEEDNHESN